jgi:hypothetical protein
MYYIEGSPVEQQGPTHWNPIGSSMIAQRPVLSPSSILRPTSCHCAFIVTRKNLPRVTKMLIFNFSFLLFFLFCLCRWVSAVTLSWKLSALVSERAPSLYELILHIARDSVLNMRVSQKINVHAYSSGTKGQTVWLYRRNSLPSDCHQITALKQNISPSSSYFGATAPSGPWPPHTRGF